MKKMMDVESLKLSAHGYVHCNSSFYSAQALLYADKVYEFAKGINILKGEIDSDVWAISYYISMYNHKPWDFEIFDSSDILINNQLSTMNYLSKISCYMDFSFPMFSVEKTVKELVEDGIKEQKINFSSEDIKEIFCLDSQRFNKPLKCIGNERFRAMAAIAYSRDKQIFCFPWFSKQRFEGYHRNITWLLEKLDEQNKIVVLPINS